MGAVVFSRSAEQQFAVSGGHFSGTPIEDECDLPMLARMRFRPFDRRAARLGIPRDGTVKRQFKSALGRIGNSFHALFEIAPAFRLPLCIKLQTMQPFCTEQQ